MSIASEITRLQNAKADLKTAIEGKGVTVASSAKLDAYPALVESISGGSIEDLITKENLVSIVAQVEYVQVTLDTSNNFTANDVYISQVSFGNVVFTFNDITLQWNNKLYSISPRKNFLGVNNINFGVEEDRDVIHIYLNNEIIGTINYED